MATNEKNYYPNCDGSIFLRSCEQEITEPLKGEVKGAMPKWLRGTLLRNGPGSLKVGSMRFDHVFDSSALLHRFAIHDGHVTYQCRFLRSNTFKRNRAADRIVVTEYGTKSVPDPCHTIFDRVASFFKPGESITDNALISLYPFGDEIYAFTEAPTIHRIDPNTLDTMKSRNMMYDFAIVYHTAHPHVAPNGDVYNVGLSLVKGRLRFIVVKFPFTGKGDMFERAHIVGTMSPRWSLHPAYMHTFGITENYFVILEQPLSISLYSKVRNYLTNEPLVNCLKWYPEHGTHIVLISRKDGTEVKRYRTEPLFFLHIINAFEQNGRLVVDLCAYKDAKVIDAMYVHAIETMQSNADYAKWFRSRPKRLEMSLDAPNLTRVEPRMLADIGCETPRIHYDMCNGRPYRYFYAISSDVDVGHPGSIIKVDTKAGETKIWNDGECYPSEPIFVPSPNAKEEDDGVLLSAVVWGSERPYSVALLVLDASSMSELARAEFRTPSPVPKCLHGWFLPERDIGITPISWSVTETIAAPALSEIPKQSNVLATATYDVPGSTELLEEDRFQYVDGIATGIIPHWLNGCLLRNGPGATKVGSMEFNHLFDCSALLHRFAVKDGRATYQCRFLRSTTFKKNRTANRIVVSEFGTESVPDPCHTIFDRLSSIFKPLEAITDNNVISLYPFGDQIYALAEVPFIHRINPMTLDTLERKKLIESAVVVCHTSHPHVMPNGDVYNVGLSALKGRPRHVIVKFPYVETGDMFERASVVGSVTPRWALNPSYMHSFGITENYFVILEQPLVISLMKSVYCQLTGAALRTSLNWYPEYETEIVLISRSTGEETSRYKAKTFFFVHIINCFEKDEILNVDLCTYKDANIIDGMYLEALKNMQSNPNYAEWFRSKAERIEIPLKAPAMSRVQVHQLSKVGCEVPRINYSLCNGKPYRYFYAISSDVDAENPGSLIKVDVKTAEVVCWKAEKCFASEPVFVAAPDAKEEDDGVLLSSLLYNGKENLVTLLILDAKNMREIARSDFVTPSAVPRDFHGWFLPAQGQ